jgi:hypothetical protein
MMNSVAVRAEHYSVSYGVKTAVCLLDTVMSITSGFIPSAPLAFVAVVPDYSFCPRVTGLVAAGAVLNGIALAIIPRAFNLPFLGVCI